MSEEVAAPEAGAEQQPVANQAEQVPVAETQPAPETGAPEQPPQENKAKERLSLRFSELTAQRNAERERAERAEREAQELRQRLYQPPAYDDHSQGYIDPSDPQAITAIVQQALETERRQRAELEAQTTQAQRAQSLQSKLIESGLEGAVIVATEGDFPLTQSMVEALAVSDNPALVANHLGHNRAEAARIAALSPIQQGVELARLEARLASQTRTTGAPPPYNTVGARATAALDPKNMTMEQYKAARESGAL